MPQGPTSNITFLLFLCLALIVSGCGYVAIPTKVPESNAPVEKPLESVHLAFGNPSNATEDPTNKDNFLIVGEGHVISYNNSRGTANWIAWRTTAADLGEALPRPEFRPDPRLPNGYRRINFSDYSRSGYDRGHLVPSADRFANPQLNSQTFYMTNIVPQRPALNQHSWQKLESHGRALARRGFDVYSYAGVYGDAGRIRNGVVVPTNCWRVMIAVPAGSDLLALDGRTRVIAADFPNIEGIENKNWREFRTTVRKIEQRTGLDLLSSLSQETQERIETTVEIESR